MKKILWVFILLAHGFSWAEPVPEETVEHVLLLRNAIAVQAWISQNKSRLSPPQALRVFQKAYFSWTWQRSRSLVEFLDHRMASLEVDEFLPLAATFDWNPTADKYRKKYAEIRARNLDLPQLLKVVATCVWNLTSDAVLFLYAEANQDRLLDSDYDTLLGKVTWIPTQEKIQAFRELARLAHPDKCPKLVTKGVGKPTLEPQSTFRDPLWDAELDAH